MNSGDIFNSWGVLQWLSGGVLDLRSWGSFFDARQKHCVVSLSNILYLLLSLVERRKTGNCNNMTENMLTGT